MEATRCGHNETFLELGGGGDFGIYIFFLPIDHHAKFHIFIFCNNILGDLVNKNN